MTKVFFNRLSLLAVCLLTVLSACNDATIIGTEFIDDSEYLFAEQDTFTLRLHTVTIDTLSTTNIDRSFLLGAMNDSIFGKTTAGFYTEFMLTQDDITFGMNPKIDSVVLTFNYSNPIYGDPSSASSIKVYEVTESILNDINYPLSQTFDIDETPLGVKTDFVPDINSSVFLNSYVKRDELADTIVVIETEPHLRIKLNNEFGQRLLDYGEDTTNLTLENFRNFLKGIYVEGDPNSESMIALNLYDPLRNRSIASRSRLSVYYNNDEDKGHVVNFLIDDSSAVVAHYDIDYTGSVVGDVLQQPYPNSQEYFYTQSIGALGVSLDIPNLSKLGVEKAIINKVEIEMTLLEVYNSSYSNETYPPSVILRTQESNASTLDPGHFYLSAVTDTILKEGENLKQLYRFNYTGSSYVQSINSYFQGRLDGLLIDGTTFDDQKSLLFAHPLSDTGYRGVFGGPDHPDHPMTMRIIYTPVTD